MNSLFVGFIIINVSSFFIPSIIVSWTLSYCKSRIFVIDNSFTFLLIIYYSSGDFDSNLCKVFFNNRQNSSEFFSPLSFVVNKDDAV